MKFFFIIIFIINISFSLSCRSLEIMLQSGKYVILNINKEPIDYNIYAFLNNHGHNIYREDLQLDFGHFFKI